MRKFYRGRRGSAFLWVLCVFTILLALTGAMMTASLNLTVTSGQKINGQQAYFTARTVGNAILNKISSDETLRDAISNLTAGNSITTSTVSDPKLGSYYSVITYNAGSGEITVTTHSNYRGQNNTVVIHLSMQTFDASNPFGNLFYEAADDAKPACIEGVDNDGSVTYNGDLSISKGSSVDNFVFTMKNLWISNKLSILTTPDYTKPTCVASKGNMYLGTDYFDQPSQKWNYETYLSADRPARVSCGTLYCMQNLTLNDGAQIGADNNNDRYGCVYVAGNLKMSDYSNIYAKTVIVGGNLIMDSTSSIYNYKKKNDSSANNGQVLVHGTITANADIEQFYGASPEQSETVIPTFGIDYTPPENLPVNIGTDPSGDNSVNNPLYTVAAISGGSGNGQGSGFISPVNYGCVLPQNPYDYVYTETYTYYDAWDIFHLYPHVGTRQSSGVYDSLIINTGTTADHKPDPAKAVRLVINNPLTLKGDLLAKGDNNLYIYLADGVNLNTNGYNIGMANSSNHFDNSNYDTRIFFISSETAAYGQTITFDGKSYIRAYFYAPKALLAGDYSGKFSGSMVIYKDKLELEPQAQLDYHPSDLTGTPLEGFSKGRYSKLIGAATWSNK